MKITARLFCLMVFALLAATPCLGIIAVTWLDSPIILQSPLLPIYNAVDMNGDSIIDITFLVNGHFVGARAEGANQYLIWPSGGSNIGGDIEPLLDAFEIGPNSGDDSWMDWFGDGEGFGNLIICLEGSGGYTCVGRFAGQHAYMGVEFDIEGATHYGWIDLLVASGNPYAEIYGWGYETDPGVSILAGAGAVPEPGTSILIGMGLLCLIRKRSKPRS